MFYSAKIFKKELSYLTDDQAEHIARVANAIIEAKGILAWGRAGEEGSINSFSSVKLPTDTHVAVVIGTKEMAIFDEDEPSKRDMPSGIEEESKQDVIIRQARELAEARNMIKSLPAKVGPQ